jgi:hypothetical protein
MVFMALFNFLEPSATIIAQTIPIFRVLINDVKRSTQKASTVGPNSPTSHAELGAAKANSLENQVWDDKVHGQPDQHHEFRNERFCDGKV